LWKKTSERRRLAAAAVRLRERGGRVLALSADTTDDKAVRTAIEHIAEELGGVDILVNNAATPAGAWWRIGALAPDLRRRLRGAVEAALKDRRAKVARRTE